MNLTPKQQKFFFYIKDYIDCNNTSPTYEEIRCYFGFSSLNSVSKHVKQLVKRGAVTLFYNKARSISLAEKSNDSSVCILGYIAAGEPIEAVLNYENIIVPDELIKMGENFCLIVKGDSMIEAGIHDGDIIVLHKRSDANNGEIAAISINNEVTLKKFYKTDQWIELKPANRRLKPKRYKSGNIFILGVLTGLIRKY